MYSRYHEPSLLDGCLPAVLGLLIAIPYIMLPPLIIGIVTLRTHVVELEAKLDRITVLEAPELPTKGSVK